MKHIRHLLVVSLLFLLLLPAKATVGADGVFLKSEQMEVIGEVNSAAPWQAGTLLGASTGIYYFPGGKAEPAMIQLPSSAEAGRKAALTAILTEGDKAYALALSEGCLWRVSLNQNGLQLGDPLQFDTKPFLIAGQDGAERMLVPAQVLLVGDTLCVLTRFMHELGGSLLLTIDMKSGAVHSLPQVSGQVISHVSAYSPGKVLALTHIGGKMGIRSVDLLTGSQEAFATLDGSLGRVETAILYAPDEDVLYILSGMRLFKRNAAGKLTETGYFNIGSGDFIRFGRLSLVGAGQIALAHPEGMAVGSVMDTPQQPLVILGLDEWDPVHVKARQMMGNTPLHPLHFDHGEVDVKLAEVLVGGLAQPDVFTIYADDIDTFRMMKKGYVADLSEQDDLAAFVDSTYPTLKELCFHEGRLYFLPIDVQHAGISMDPGAFEQTGLKAPASIPELISLMDSWPELADQWAGFSLLSSVHPRGWVVDAIWHIWLADNAAQDGPLSLQDARLEQMLTLANQVDWASWPRQAAEQSNLPLFPQSWESSFDLRRWTSYMSASRAGELLKGFTSFPLPLSMDGQAEAVLPLRVKLMGINSHSKQAEQAIQYLTSYVQSMSAQQRMLLSPKENEPIPDPQLSKMIAWAEENLRLASEALDKAEIDANLPLLRERLEQAQRLVNYWHQAPPLVSEEAIQTYHDLIAHSFALTYQNTGGVARNSLETLLSRLRMGTIAVDELMREGERVLRLALTEDE